MLIEGNYFQNDGPVSIGTNGTISVTLSRDTFATWSGVDAVENWASYDSSHTIVERSNFLESGHVALELPPGYTNAALTSLGNYFGSSDPSVAQSMLYDKHVDLNSAGYIENTNVQVAPVAEAPMSAACFARGTCIRTTRGEIAVEGLVAGDQVVTADQKLRPIIWIGYRRVDCRDHNDPKSVQPIRVSAGAFGPNLPNRDLFLSPDHAVHAENVLIPVKILSNGSTICQISQDIVEYFHVELERHDLVLAEGLAVESFLDTGQRAGFVTRSTLRRDPPILAAVSLIWEAKAYAPLLVCGGEVSRTRQHLQRRAEILSIESAARLRHPAE